MIRSTKYRNIGPTTQYHVCNKSNKTEYILDIWEGKTDLKNLLLPHFQQTQGWDSSGLGSIVPTSLGTPHNRVHPYSFAHAQDSCKSEKNSANIGMYIFNFGKRTQDREQQGSRKTERRRDVCTKTPRNKNAWKKALD